MRHWYVLGAGSLGGLWACRLASAGFAVTLLLRSDERLAQYRKAGGLVLGAGGASRQWALPAELLTTAAPISHLLLACKAYDAEAAATLLAARLQPGAQVLLLQNGLGSQQAVRQRLPSARCVAVSSTEGAFRQHDWHIVPAGLGQNWLGDGGAAPAWLADLSAAGIPHEWAPDIDGRLWRKLAINCAINPLTVLLGCRNGELMQHRDHLAVLCTELEHLLHACDQPQAAAGLLADVLRVVQATAQNHSSMLQDVRRRQRTEIDYLIGYAVAQAQQRGLPLPALQALYTRLRDHLRGKGLAGV